MMDETLADKLAIRDVVETWAIARDSGDWETFRAQWADDGYMMASWFQGPADAFVRASREGWARGVASCTSPGGARSVSRALARSPRRG